MQTRRDLILCSKRQRSSHYALKSLAASEDLSRHHLGFWSVLTDFLKGVHVMMEEVWCGGLLYADDITLVADSESRKQIWF